MNKLIKKAHLVLVRGVCIVLATGAFGGQSHQDEKLERGVHLLFINLLIFLKSNRPVG